MQPATRAEDPAITTREQGPTAAQSWLAALVCAALAALLLWGPLFGGQCALSFDVRDPRLDVRPWTTQPLPGVALPAINPVTPDIDFYVVPGILRLRQLAAQGASGLWDGSQLLGYPLEANLTYPTASPATWWTGAVEPVTALDWLLWMHLTVAAWLAFRAVRLLGAGAPAAACAAAGFALSGWMSTRWHLPHILYTTAFFPGLLCALAWWRRGAFARGTAEGALWLGLMLRSGHPQVGLTLLLGFLALIPLLGLLRQRTVLLGAAVSTVLGVLLALPLLQLSGAAYAESLRATPQTRALTASEGVAPGALCAALLPEFFGRPSDFASDHPPAATMRQWLPQRRLLSDAPSDNVVENALYPGALLLLLLPLLLLKGAPREGRALAALAVLALAATIVWPLLVRAVPGLALFAAGSSRRLLVLWSAGVPLAGGFALQALLARRVRPSLLVTLALLAAVAAAPLLAGRVDDPAAADFAAALVPQAWRQAVLLLAGAGALVLAARGSRVLAWLPALLLLLDLAPLALAFNPFQVQSEPFPRTPALAALEAREGRVMVLGAPNLLPPSAAAVHGIESVHGVAAIMARRTAELLACIEGPLFDPADPRVGRPFHAAASLTHPLLDLLNVTTVVHADPGLAAATGWPVVFEHPEEGLGALERPTAGPRAFVCGGAELQPDDVARLARLASRDFPVHGTVLLERETGLALPPQGPMQPARIAAARADHVTLETDAPFDGILVLANAWDPGWRVTVDGIVDRVLVADHALLGVALPAGPHRVEFTYDPHGRGRTQLAAAAALACVLALAAGAWRSRRTPPAARPDDGSPSS